MARKHYYREQKHICGKNYMEVDIYQVSEREHKASIRAKKTKASSLAQENYNNTMAKRYQVQLANTNFVEGDFSLTLTYDDAHRPAFEDRKRADMDVTNYIDRLYRYCKKMGIARPKWIFATEYATLNEKGKIIGKHHHHAIIQKVEGLTRDILEKLWVDSRRQPMGMARCDSLMVEHGSVERLVRYITKNKRCDRSWRHSRNLEKPVTPKPNDSKWNRTRLEKASTLYVDDAAYWEQQYPGYTLNRVDTRVSDDGRRHTTVILRRAECHHRGRLVKPIPRINR